MKLSRLKAWIFLTFSALVLLAAPPAYSQSQGDDDTKITINIVVDPESQWLVRR